MLVIAKKRKTLFNKKENKVKVIKETPNNLVINFQTGKGRVLPHAKLLLSNTYITVGSIEGVEGKLYLVPTSKENGFKINEEGYFSGKLLLGTINDIINVASTEEEASKVTNLTFRIEEVEVTSDGDTLYPLTLIGKGMKEIEVKEVGEEVGAMETPVLTINNNDNIQF